MGPALERFVAGFLDADLSAVFPRGRLSYGYRHLFPRPSRGGPCKRLHLFLRWMVRREPPDFGLWPDIPALRPPDAGRHPRRAHGARGGADPAPEPQRGRWPRRSRRACAASIPRTRSSTTSRSATSACPATARGAAPRRSASRAGSDRYAATGEGTARDRPPAVPGGGAPRGPDRGGVDALAHAIASCASWRSGTAPMVEALERQLEAVRAEGRSGQDALRGEVGELSARVKVELVELRAGVAAEVQGLGREVGRQLHDGMRLIQDAHSTRGRAARPRRPRGGRGAGQPRQARRGDAAGDRGRARPPGAGAGAALARRCAAASARRCSASCSPRCSRESTTRSSTASAVASG